MDHGVHGHICMFDGNQWISDFVQNNMWVYGGDGTCYIFRYNGEIDPTLDAYQDVYSTGLRYNVPIDMQEDHKLIKDIVESRRNIILGILENIGDFGLEGINEDGFRYYLAVKTLYGQTIIAYCGPIMPDIDILPSGFSTGLNKMEYKEDRLNKFISL